MVFDPDDLIVFAEEVDAHARIYRLNGASELGDIVGLFVYAVEDDRIAVSEIVCEKRLHVSEVITVSGSIDNYDSCCQSPALRHVDLLEKFSRGDRAVPFDEYDTRLMLCLDVESQFLVDIIGIAVDYHGVSALVILGDIFLFTFFGVDYHNFAVLEVLSADPGTDDRSLSAVQETGEKINQTIIHK